MVHPTAVASLQLTVHITRFCNGISSHVLVNSLFILTTSSNSTDTASPLCATYVITPTELRSSYGCVPSGVGTLFLVAPTPSAAVNGQQQINTVTSKSRISIMNIELFQYSPNLFILIHVTLVHL
jgi:hypothetical protein